MDARTLAEQAPDLHYTNEAYAISFCKSVDEIIQRLKKFAILAINESRESWVTITDDPRTLPELPDVTNAATGKIVLVVIEGDLVAVPFVTPVHFRCDGRFYWLGGGLIEGIKRWQPLPSPPKADSSQGDTNEKVL